MNHHPPSHTPIHTYQILMNIYILYLWLSERNIHFDRFSPFFDAFLLSHLFCFWFLSFRWCWSNWCSLTHPHLFLYILMLFFRMLSFYILCYCRCSNPNWIGIQAQFVCNRNWNIRNEFHGVGLRKPIFSLHSCILFSYTHYFLLLLVILHISGSFIRFCFFPLFYEHARSIDTHSKRPFSRPLGRRSPVFLMYDGNRTPLDLLFERKSPTTHFPDRKSPTTGMLRTL